MYVIKSVSQRIFAFSLLVLVICIIGTLKPAAAESRIVGGNEISIAQARYMVQLRYNGGTFCGGTLVAPQFVISAAHCFNGLDYRNVKVVCGANTLHDIGVQRGISTIRIHPHYNPQTMYSDAVVIKLAQPISGNNISPVRLCSRPLQAANLVQVSGWGKTAGNQPMSVKLKSVMVPVQSWAKCKGEFGQYAKQDVFCGSGLEAKGICNGDSGGPAVYGGELCGINAFMYQCGVAGRMSAFTDVFGMRPFLENAMKTM